MDGIQITKIRTMYIPESWMQREHFSVAEFTDMFKAKRYLFYEGYIYVFNYVDHVVDYVRLKDGFD